MAHNTRAKWQWKTSGNACSSSDIDDWCSYSDVETVVIEEAFQNKCNEVILNDYHIDFTQLIQICNNDTRKKWPIKRVVSKVDKMKLREDRFMLDSVVPRTSFSEQQYSFLYECYDYFQISGARLLKETTDRQKMVEKAADGLIVEAKKIGKQTEGQWMAEKLLNVKNGTEEEIWGLGVSLYCMETFLYKKLNEIMRLVNDYDKKYEVLWKSKISTFGPFALLLWILGWERGIKEELTVYRGAQLMDNMIEQYRQKHETTSQKTLVQFPAFTSTSRSRRKASGFGNVLFVIKIGKSNGWDVSAYSEYNEEEVLLAPNFYFYISSCEYDKADKKWIIYLRAPGIN